MARVLSESDLDEAWLDDHLQATGIRATNDQIDAFLERVAIRVESGMDPATARTLTLREQFY